ncbi:ABC transporter permease [Helicobacter marmotae]|uniref:ABC transporter permease n=1 Tax=Helicobacter marmotae TaxID=152490 RepID=A0A3D8I3D3_9HELI|nr:ABC transporter permease [Helicobacter marmotae]RDU59622.1 ABC transporter permease [Helicobacter marmotae]
MREFYSTFILEAKSIFTSVSAMLIIFGGSLFYLFLYPTPYYADVVSPQRVAIVDYDMSSSSRELISFLRASPHLEIVQILSHQEQGQKLIESQAIYGLIIIPHDFQKHLYERIPPVVAIMANASYLLIYGAIVNASTEALEAFNTHLKNKAQIHEHEILSPKLIPLFNPSMGYINYTLAPILIFILHQTLVAGAGIIGGTQNQQFAQGVRNYYSKANPFVLVLSKIMVFFCIYVLLFAFYFGFAYEFYGVSVHAHVLDFWLFSIAFILSTAAFGVFFGTLLPKRALSTQIIMLASMPIVFLLGFIWQEAQIAPWASSLISFLPAYHGINGLLELNQMGASFGSIWGYFVSLCILGILYSIASALIIYKKTLRL